MLLVFFLFCFVFVFPVLGRGLRWAWGWTRCMDPLYTQGVQHDELELSEFSLLLKVHTQWIWWRGAHTGF